MGRSSGRQPEAEAAAARYDAIYNRWFLGAIFRKDTPRWRFTAM